MSLPARQAHVARGERARPREARIDVDDLRAALARLHHPLEADRMASAMFEPMIRMQSAFCRSCWKVVVAPPRPNEVPRPGTVEECHMRAWFSTWTTPSAVISFLMR